MIFVLVFLRCSLVSECNPGGWVSKTCPAITSVAPASLQYSKLNTTKVITNIGIKLHIIFPLFEQPFVMYLFFCVS